MPHAVSRRQYRMMQAILHGKKVDQGSRGRPPKEVARKYIEATGSAKDLPEQSGEDRGGSWTDKHHAKHHKKESKKHGGKESSKGKEHRSKSAHHLKEHRKKLKKAFEEFYKGRGRAVATLIINSENKVLLGKHNSGKLAFPGGHLEPNEGFEDAALREMHEEAGVLGKITSEIYRGSIEGNETVVYLAEIAKGKPKDTTSDDGKEKMSSWKWYDISDIPWDKLRNCCLKPLKQFIDQKLGKSLEGLVALEKLEKNIIRQRGDAVFEVSHGDALKIVGNGVFRALKKAVEDMEDEDFKDLKFDSHVISIRKHMNDVYSGRVSDGHKVVYQFTNKSLPELAVALMSIFEWYLPEDEKELELLDDKSLSDDAIEGGLNELIDNYKKHNIGNIYEEMETIRQQLRNGVAVDLQQVETKILKLFDKLENVVHEAAGKHNKLCQAVGKDLDELERKLRALQEKIDNDNKKPDKIEAVSSNLSNQDKVHSDFYSYLTKPRIEIMPNGKITISFGGDWQDLEKENFLKDMKAKVVNKK